MKKFWDIAVPYFGIEIDITIIYHTLRDIFIILILWLLGYHGFQAAFTLLLVSGFFEAGNGVAYSPDGSHCFYNPLDVLPSVFVGFLAVSILSGIFDWMLLVKLILIYVIANLILVVLNKILRRDIIIRQSAS